MVKEMIRFKNGTINFLLLFALAVLLIGGGCKRQGGPADFEPDINEFIVNVKGDDHYPEFSVQIQYLNSAKGLVNCSELKDMVSVSGEGLNYHPEMVTDISYSPVMDIYINPNGFEENELRKIQRMTKEILETHEEFELNRTMHLYSYDGGFFPIIPEKIYALETDSDNSDWIAAFRDQIEKADTSFEQNRIILVISNVMENTKFSEIEDVLNEAEKKEYLWWGAITKGPVPVLDDLNTDNALFIKDVGYINRTAFLLKDAIRSIERSYSEARFKIGILDPVKRPFEFQISISDPLMEEIELDLKMDYSLIVDRYVEEVDSLVSGMLRRKYYNNSFNKIVSRGVNKVGFTHFDKLVTEILTEWSDSLSRTNDIDRIEKFILKIESELPQITSRTSFWDNGIVLGMINSLIKYIKEPGVSLDEVLILRKRISGLIPEGLAWTAEKRLEVLNTVSARLSGKQEYSDQRLKIFDEIIELSPADNGIRYKKNILLAEKALQTENYLKSMNHYTRALKYLSDKNIEAEMAGLTSRGIHHYFKAGQYYKVIDFQKKYLKHDPDNFANHYYISESAARTNKYELLIDNLEWLVNNWDEKQKLTDWNEIIGKLQENYIFTGNFERSRLFTKKLILSHPEKIDELGIYFISQRVIPYDIFMKALSLIYPINGHSLFKNIFKSINEYGLNDYVKYLAVLNTNGTEMPDLVYTASGYSRPDLTRIVNGQSVDLQKSGDENLLIYSRDISDLRIVVAISSEYKNKEMTLAMELGRNPQSGKNWFYLDSELIKKQRDEFTYLLSYVASVYRGALSNNYLDKLKSVITDYDLVSYLVFHNNSSKIIYSHNFERDKFSFSKQDWNRSSKTPALYRNTVSGTDKKFMDIAQPLYYNGEWIGAVRFGFELND